MSVADDDSEASRVTWLAMVVTTGNSPLPGHGSSGIRPVWGFRRLILSSPWVLKIKVSVLMGGLGPFHDT
jgi:hypothetical protein